MKEEALALLGIGVIHTKDIDIKAPSVKRGRRVHA